MANQERNEELVVDIVEPIPSYVQCPICNEVSSIQDAGHNGICPHCVKESVERQEKREVRRQAKFALKKMIAAARPSTIDAPHISEVCAGVIRELGGMDDFCQELAEDYRDARERSPGSSTVMRFGETILRLVRDSTSQRDSAPDAVEMTDEAIVSEMMSVMDDMARKNNLSNTDEGVLELLGVEDSNEPRDSGEKTDPGTSN